MSAAVSWAKTAHFSDPVALLDSSPMADPIQPQELQLVEVTPAPVQRVQSPGMTLSTKRDPAPEQRVVSLLPEQGEEEQPATCDSWTQVHKQQRQQMKQGKPSSQPSSAPTLQRSVRTAAPNLRHAQMATAMPAEMPSPKQLGAFVGNQGDITAAAERAFTFLQQGHEPRHG